MFPFVSGGWLKNEYMALGENKMGHGVGLSLYDDFLAEDPEFPSHSIFLWGPTHIVLYTLWKNYLYMCYAL